MNTVTINGKGKINFISCIYEGKYVIRDFHNSKSVILKNGGKATFPDGTIYTGKMIYNPASKLVRLSKGMMVTPNGITYDGDFQLISGKSILKTGLIEYPSGASYVGTFGYTNGKYTQNGIYLNPNAPSNYDNAEYSPKTYNDDDMEDLEEPQPIKAEKKVVPKISMKSKKFLPTKSTKPTKQIEPEEEEEYISEVYDEKPKKNPYVSTKKAYVESTKKSIKSTSNKKEVREPINYDNVAIEIDL